MAWSHLLVGTDDSPAGLHAVMIAEALARASGAHLTVATVSPRTDRDAEEARWQERARRLARGVHAFHALEGIPGIELVRLSEEVRADLIVLGRHLSGAPDNPQLGHTADAVVRRSMVPCLFVPLGQGRFDRILTAVDGSERSVTVQVASGGLQTLLGGADIPGRALRCVMTEPRSDWSRADQNPDGAAGGVATVPTGREVRLREWFHRARITTPPITVRFGDPVAEINGMIREWEADVLVVGAHRGGPGGVPDSTGVGRSLLYTASCAVLTVPL